MNIIRTVKDLKDTTFDRIIKGLEEDHTNYVYYKDASEQFVAYNNHNGHGVVVIDNNINKIISDKFDNIDKLFDWYTKESTASNYRIQFVCFADYVG